MSGARWGSLIFALTLIAACASDAPEEADGLLPDPDRPGFQLETDDRQVEDAPPSGDEQPPLVIPEAASTSTSGPTSTEATNSTSALTSTEASTTTSQPNPSSGDSVTTDAPSEGSIPAASTPTSTSVSAPADAQGGGGSPGGGSSPGDGGSPGGGGSSTGSGPTGGGFDLSGDGVSPVQATYQGVKSYNGFRVSEQYDAWTHGDLVLYTPPGRVTQEMANQWLAWQATTDAILRTLIGDDETFDSKYRSNDPHFGRKKVIATPHESCGAGCGNKQIAEGVGIIDAMVAEPGNFEHQWILFYEQARGGRDEVFDLSASWPREQYVLPHLVAALTFYQIGGMEALQRGVPGDILSGKQRWEDSGLTYTDVFIEREQRWFEDKYADGTIIFPPQPSLLLHIGVEDGVDALARVLANLGHYPDNLMYENSTDAICDFQAAVNDATGNKYATWMVQDWGLPGNCDYDMGQQASTAAFADDLRFESSGLCVDPRFMPNAARPGHFPCNGAAEQKVSFEPVAEDRFLIKFTSTGQCFEGLSVWTCHGDPHQVWEWRGAQLYNVGVDKCLTARQNNRWGGGLLTMETCADTPAQRINSG